MVEAGVTGTLVPAGDPRALATALRAYVADEKLRRRHGDAGCVRVAAHFSLRAMVSAYVALYDELLGRQTGAVQPRVMSGLTGHKEN